MTEPWPVSLEHAFALYVAQLREAVEAEIALGTAYPTVDTHLSDSHPAVRRHDREMGRAMSLLRDLEAAAHREGVDRARKIAAPKGES